MSHRRGRLKRKMEEVREEARREIERAHYWEREYRSAERLRYQAIESAKAARCDSFIPHPIWWGIAGLAWICAEGYSPIGLPLLVFSSQLVGLLGGFGLGLRAEREWKK